MSIREHEKNIRFYSDLLSEHGIDPRALNWGSKKSQQTRFQVLAQIASLEGKKILDIGCGLGDLYEWLGIQKINTAYHGVDITPKMVEAATKRFPGVRFEVASVKDISVSQLYDFVFASGIFYLVETDPFAHMQQTIATMFSLCKQGIAFNSLSDWAVNKTSGEFYASPTETLNFCKTLSPYVVMRHDYHPADFTIYVYKENQSL